MNTIFVPTNRPVQQSLIQTVGITKLGVYIEASSGFGQSSDSIHWDHGIVSAEIGQLSTIPPKQRTYEAIQSYRKRKKNLPHEAFMGGFILEKIASPLSKGQLSLLNMNIDDNPSITFNYFSHPYDLQRCVDDTVITIWHYHGGCHTGKVVSRDYEVLGVERLRVIDGSTFTDSPGTNPQATVMMLGRYMGVKISRERLGRAAGV
ncbi:Protein HOTHEAD [Abeliophyllum distichum]|uniref:Protein HOTHEAD n=1 Tax=Abeliophyllum distichum TaxID=126358 RepID=A0ABD1V9N5_9LAMI